MNKLMDFKQMNGRLFMLMGIVSFPTLLSRYYFVGEKRWKVEGADSSSRQC